MDRAEADRPTLATRYKSKLRRGWSYPIGAMELSAALGGLPEPAAEPLSFRDRAGWFHSKLDAARAEDVPYPIVRVHLGRGGLLSRNPDEVAWEVHIYAVPSSVRAAVRRTLIPWGLPVIRSWLTGPHAETALDGGASCTLLVRESDGSVLVEQRESRFADPVRTELAPPPDDTLPRTSASAGNRRARR